MKRMRKITKISSSSPKPHLAPMIIWIYTINIKSTLKPVCTSLTRRD